MPEFEAELMESYMVYKDNAKVHRAKKSQKRKENSQKHQPRKKLLEEKHLKFLKDYIDNEDNKEQTSLRTLT